MADEPAATEEEQSEDQGRTVGDLSKDELELVAEVVGADVSEGSGKDGAVVKDDLVDALGGDDVPVKALRAPQPAIDGPGAYGAFAEEGLDLNPNPGSLEGDVLQRNVTHRGTFYERGTAISDLDPKLSKDERERLVRLGVISDDDE